MDDEFLFGEHFENEFLKNLNAKQKSIIFHYFKKNWWAIRKSIDYLSEQFLAGFSRKIPVMSPKGY